MAADIYNQILNESGEKLSTEICGRISYLRVRVIYECGREIKVKEFVNQAGLLEILSDIKGSRKIIFCFISIWKLWLRFTDSMAEKNSRRNINVRKNTNFGRY